MTKINQDCTLTVKEHGKRVVEISAIYNNKFIRRLYIGDTKEKAIEKFKAYLKSANL